MAYLIQKAVLRKEGCRKSAIEFIAVFLVEVICARNNFSSNYLQLATHFRSAIA